MMPDIVQMKEGELRGRSGHVEASAQSHQKRRRRCPKARQRHCTGKKSGQEDVDDQAKALARGGTARNKSVETSRARRVLRHGQVREATVVPVGEES
jgi:hypothetical protein